MEFTLLLWGMNRVVTSHKEEFLRSPPLRLFVRRDRSPLASRQAGRFNRPVRFRKVTVVGVGLLGGLLGLALKKHRLAESVVGVVRRASSLAECERLEVLDEATE
jgi:hypothetical protein